MIIERITGKAARQVPSETLKRCVAARQVADISFPRNYGEARVAPRLEWRGGVYAVYQVCLVGIPLRSSSLFQAIKIILASLINSCMVTVYAEWFGGNYRGDLCQS